MRQAAFAYLVFPEAFGKAIASWSGEGVIVGKACNYFSTSLVHEHGHAVDGALLVPGEGSYSDSTSWLSQVAFHRFAATAYGTTPHAENFADIGRRVLINNTYPGGMAALFPNHPNVTQIARQVSTFQADAGQYYHAGTTCDLAKKFPYPSAVVDGDGDPVRAVRWLGYVYRPDGVWFWVYVHYAEPLLRPMHSRAGLS